MMQFLEITYLRKMNKEKEEEKEGEEREGRGKA